MKTKITSFLIAFFSALLSHAQLSGVEYDSKQFNQFKASKTYVLLTGDQKFDSEMQATLADIWKITPYEFISSKDFEAKMPDKSASFLMFFDVFWSNREEEHYLTLINGGRKKFTQYTFLDFISYCPINHWLNEPKNVDCAFRIRNMVQSMLQSIEIVEKNSISGNFYKIEEKLQRIYNEKAPSISKKTLLICEDGIGTKLPKSDISGIYPYKFEMCTKEKIEQVIKDKNADYCYLQMASTKKKSIYVFDAATGEVLYYDFTPAFGGMNIKKSHIEHLVDIINWK